MTTTAAQPDLAARPRDSTSTRPVVAIALVAAATVVTFEVLRTLYPLGYSLVGDLGFIVTPVVLLLVFLTPLLAVPVRRLPPGTALLAAAATMAAARLALQVLAPPGLALSVVAVALTLPAMTVLIGRVLDVAGGGTAVALGVMSGVGLDAVLKGAYAAWDRVWQPGLGPILVTSALVAALVIAARALRPEVLREGEPRHGRVARMASVGLLLMPTMLVHGSIAHVASSGGVGLAAAAFAVAGGAALAVLLGGAAVGAGSRAVGAAAAVGLAIATWWSRSTTGGVVVVLAVVALVLTAVLLVALLTDEPTEPRAPSLLRTATGATLGFVGMFALTLLHPMHYEMPLPVTNDVLPVLAIGLAALGLLAPREPREPVSMRVALAPALALAAGAVVTALGVTATAHDHTELAIAEWPLMVGSLNVDQGATESGVLDFEAVADTIDLLDADLVALQEVGRGWPLSGMNDLALWLEHERGTTQQFAPAADEQFGNLLVTQVDLADVRTLPLPRGGGSMDRSAIVATVPTDAGDVTVYAVHLQHRNSAASIDARADELAVLLTDWGGAPRTIVMGDLNANNQRAPDGGPKLLVGPGQANTLQPLLDAGFTTTQPTERCTLPTSNENCSDYVLVTTDLVQEPPVEVLEPAPVGDHRPIRSTVTVR